MKIKIKITIMDRKQQGKKGGGGKKWQLFWEHVGKRYWVLEYI